MKNLASKLDYNVPVILSYTIISFFVLILGYLTNDRSTGLLFCVYRSDISIFFIFRLIGHIFGHVGFEHFINNFLIILLIGPMVEEKYGSKNMLFMIMLTAVVTGLFNILFFDTALLGASGVAFMLIVAGSYVNIKKGRIPLSLILTAVLYLGKEIYLGLFVPDDISRISHVLGGFLGAAFGYGLKLAVG